MIILKDHIDLTSIIESAGFELKRPGTRHVGLCPFHVDREPSFYVFGNKLTKSKIGRWLRPLWVELEMLGLLPEKIGQYRVADILLKWEERQ